MASYEYGCGDCGPFVAMLPIGTAGPACPCPGCGGEARRLWSVPAMLTGGPVARVRSLADASSDAPQVVRRAPVPAHSDPPPPKRYGPAQQALPRP